MVDNGTLDGSSSPVCLFNLYIDSFSGTVQGMKWKNKNEKVTLANDGADMELA